jgi:hypothetical protein
MFSTKSRYYSLPVLKWSPPDSKTPDADAIAYVSRRFLPSGDEFDLLQLHTVREGDRLDNITAQYLDDAEQFWRVADANEAMSPFELTDTVGETIRITLPQGIPGPSRA